MSCVCQRLGWPFESSRCSNHCGDERVLRFSVRISFRNLSVRISKLTAPRDFETRRIYLIHGLTIRFAGKAVLKIGRSHDKEICIRMYSRLRTYEAQGYPQGTALERMNFAMTRSRKEHAADVERPWQEGKSDKTASRPKRRKQEALERPRKSQSSRPPRTYCSM